ncbi:hypothetical protein [Pseudofrankia sp. DC12]|nr:hypothetical protein [Pseudofrankia sp. DC12]
MGDRAQGFEEFGGAGVQVEDGEGIAEVIRRVREDDFGAEDDAC